MNGTKAEDILDSFLEGLKPLNINKMIQVSMDGPNVNWKFYHLLTELENVNVIQSGSCSLPVVHGAFRKQLTGVSINF